MKYSILDIVSHSLAGIIFSIFFFIIGGFVFYLPALLWYHLAKSGYVTLTGNGIESFPPRFIPTVIKGYLNLFTLGIIGLIGSKFIGAGGRFGGGGASGKW